MDVLIVRTSDDGSYETLTPADLDLSEVGDLGALAGASSGLLSGDDMAAIAEIMEPNVASLALVYRTCGRCRSPALLGLQAAS